MVGEKKKNHKIESYQVKLAQYTGDMCLKKGNIPICNRRGFPFHMCTHSQTFKTELLLWKNAQSGGKTGRGVSDYNTVSYWGGTGHRMNIEEGHQPHLGGQGRLLMR